MSSEDSAESRESPATDPDNRKTSESSLVNQPYFSCAHISQNVHAHDE